MSENELREAMCEFGRRLWERGLVGAAEGNLSVRLDSGMILCTPAGASKGHMKPSDLVIIDGDGVPQSDNGRPSSEIKLHLRCLRDRPDCAAVIHAHPPVATAFSLTRRSIPDDLLPEAAYVLGRVALVPYSMPGTDEVPEMLAPFLADHKTFLLSHHGAAALGVDLRDAYNRMETLERVARVLLLAEVLGGAEPLPTDAAVYLARHVVTGNLT